MSGQFIDFDKCESIFYNNLYFEDSKIVLKIPICDVDYKKSKSNIKVERFDLSNRAFLMSY